jgi:putative transposase
VTSDGSKFDNPRYLNKAADNLEIKQQKLSRKKGKKESSNRSKARLLV